MACDMFTLRRIALIVAGVITKYAVSRYFALGYVNCFLQVGFEFVE